MAPKEGGYDEQVSSGSSGGGSSGMSIMSAATDLGDKLHNNFLKQVSYFRDSREERERNAKLDAESKREFNIGAAQTDRQLNMSNMGILAEQRYHNPVVRPLFQAWISFDSQ